MTRLVLNIKNLYCSIACTYEDWICPKQDFNIPKYDRTVPPSDTQEFDWFHLQSWVEEYREISASLGQANTLGSLLSSLELSQPGLCQ